MTTPPVIAAGAPPEILIVEDSPVEAELLRRTFARAGYAVSLARDGREGLDAMRARRPALVMSDINMPVMNGYQLCRAIKYDDELWNIPLVLLTVLAEPEDIIEAINCGADAYIIKPYAESNLLHRVQALVDAPIQRRRADERRQEIVGYGGKLHTISGGGQQMLNLLLSLYENTLNQNRELTLIQTQLNLLNNNLDQLVRERTAKLASVNRALQTLSACNMALVHATSEKELFVNVCRNIVETGGFPLAWVEFPPDEGGAPVFGAHFGDETLFGIHAELTRHPAHAELCPSIAARRTGRTQVCNDLAPLPAQGFALLREAGVRGILALPMQHSHELYGVLTVFAAVENAFGADEIKLMEELAGDLAYGVFMLRIRAERERMEEVRAEAEAARRANQLKSEFLANMSHELRTPLNAILGFSEILKEGVAGPLSPQQTEHVTDIFNAGNHLLSLINDVLDLSKVEAGSMTLELEAQEVAALAQAGLTMLREKAVAHRIRLTTEIQEGMDAVWLDGLKVKQIIFNLLSNAVKFTPDGGSVRLTARKIDQAPLPADGYTAWLELVVSDTGIGISAKDQARLFQPFSQVDSALSRRYQGTGLGLMLVKRLTELHGGAVALHSTPDAGTTVTVWLPWRTGGGRARE